MLSVNIEDTQRQAFIVLFLQYSPSRLGRMCLSLDIKTSGKEILMCPDRGSGARLP